MAETVTLKFLGKQMDRVLTEIGSLRDDMTVMMAILQRLDNSHSNLLTEIRATHQQLPG